MTDRPDDDRPPSYGPPAAPGGPDHGSPEYGSPQYGSPQYGAPQYGAPPYGPSSGTPAAYGAPQPYAPTEEQSALRSQAIIALVLNGLVVVATCFSALPSIGGAITAGVALGQVGTDVDRARRLVRWSWGLLITSVAIGFAIFGLIFAAYLMV